MPLIAMLLVTLGLALAACVSISEEGKETLAADVNCETAEQDIATPEVERASVLQRIGAGVRTVQPAAAVIGILRRDLKDRAKVATGAYNKEIDEKISEISSACGL